MKISLSAFSLRVIAALALLCPHFAAQAQEPPLASLDNPHPGSKAKTYEQKLKVLDAAAQAALLDTRINSSMGGIFGPFSNMFFVRSKLDSGTCIALSSEVKGIRDMELTPAFPRAYRCTLREFLDTIAQQTNTKWSYRDECQTMHSDAPGKGLQDGIAVFTFAAANIKPRFEMTPAKGWKMEEHSSWTMFVPPTAPVGMDFHVGGKLSADTPEKLKELEKSAPSDAALDQLKRVKPDATVKDLKLTKVGPYDAYLFETGLPPNAAEKFRWRQWHFAVDNQLVFVISTLDNDKEASLYPDVEEMIKTFRVRGPKESKTM